MSERSGESLTLELAMQEAVAAFEKADRAGSDDKTLEELFAKVFALECKIAGVKTSSS